ncbi:hypothetical protein VTL71DRAFT_2756 [Oculimacula yallundae]|uniref:Uncharacterized protein n=1 Tax=Oculimacula yallundae TaxID=86028 RepID=A0ABR4C9R7_9HELO
MSSFNSFKFTSQHATPRESRTRNEGENRGSHKERGGGYDSYKPGQPPSKDMIPAPVRTASTGSPFSPQHPSSLNDSRRPGIARSPSNSSPNHLPNRAISSRTNSTDQPIRNPEREEEARRYNNSRAAAQNNAKVAPKTDAPMAPAAAPSDVSVEQPSWKEKAQAIEVPSSEQGSNDSTLTLKLAEVLRTMVNEVTEVSSLKTRRNNAKAKLTKAQAEFEKTESYHSGFPSIKETQARAKKVAEQDFKKADEQLDAKDASLDQLALRVAEQIIPSIIGGSTANQQQKEMQDRITSLEKMCQNYHELLEGHKTFLDSQQEANHATSESWERRLKAVTEDVRSFKSESAKENKLLLRQNDFEDLIHPVAERVVELSNTISAIPSNLAQQLTRIQDLDKLQTKVEDLETSSQASLADLNTIVGTLDSSVSSLHECCKAGSGASKTLAQEHVKLRDNVTAFNERVARVEFKLQEAELAKQNAKADIATKHTSDLANAGPLASLEEKFETLASRLSALEGGAIQLQATVEELSNTLLNDTSRLEKKIDQASTLEAGQKSIIASDFTAIKNRLAIVESQRQATPNPSVENTNTSNGNSASGDDLYRLLSSDIAQLKAGLEGQKTDLDSLVEMTGDTIKEIVKSNIDPFIPRLDAIEATTNTMRGSLMTVENQVKGHYQAILDVKNNLVGAAAHSAIDIIKSQNLFAPANLDEKFTNSLAAVNKTALEHIEAHSLAIGGVQHRMDNLTTGDVHAAIVNTFHTTYPSLRNSEQIFRDHASKLILLDSRIGDIQKRVEEQSKQAPAPVTAPSVPAPLTEDDAIVTSIRSELNNLTQDVAKLQRSDVTFVTDLEDLKEQTSTDLAEIKRETVTLSEEVATNIFELKSAIAATDRNVTGFSGKVREFEKRVEGVVSRQTDIEKKVESSRQQRATSQVLSSVKTTITPGAFNGKLRAPSVASDASGSSKTSMKRGRSDTTGNGMKAPTGNGPFSPRKANGLKNNGRPSGSPNPKRPKRSRTKNDDDSDQDPDFEGEANQGISTDEDEELPPRPIKTKQEEQGRERVVIDIADSDSE